MAILIPFPAIALDGSEPVPAESMSTRLPDGIPTAGAESAPAAGAKASVLTINASKVTGPVRLLQGNLQGIAGYPIDPVTQAYVDDLRPAFWRTGKGYGYTWVNSTLAPQHGTKLTFILHGMFLDYYGGNDNNEPIITPGCDKATDPTCIPTWEDLKTTWANYTTSVMKSVVDNKLVIEYIDILNEPDWIWGDEITYTQVYEIVRIAHDIIRSYKPSQKIVAPSASDFNETFVKGFIDYAAANDMRIDGISWHEFHRPEYIVERIAKARAWIDAAFASKPALKIREVHINEWAGGRHHLIPGWTVGYLTFFEFVGVDVATRSCWYNTPTEPGNCKFGVGGLLTIDGKTPQHVYWAHHAYARMSGDRLMPAGKLETSSLATVVMGSKNDSLEEVRLLAGKYSCGRSGLWCKYNSSQAIDEKLPAEDLTIEVKDYPYDARVVEIRVDRVPNEVPGPLPQPARLPPVRAAVVDGGLFFTIAGFQDGEAYSMVVVPAPPGPLARIELSPQNATVDADGLVEFNATGFDSDGLPVTISPVWHAQNGSIDANGTFTPFRAGVWTVSASEGNFSATAVVTVIPGRLASVAISPAEVRMTPGQFTTFTLAARDAKGNDIAGTGVDWSASDPGVVRFVAANASWEAVAPGSATVTATVRHGGETASAAATIRVEAQAPPGPGGRTGSGLGEIVMIGLILAIALSSVVAALLARHRRARRLESAPAGFF